MTQQEMTIIKKIKDLIQKRDEEGSAKSLTECFGSMKPSKEYLKLNFEIAELGKKLLNGEYDEICEELFKVSRPWIVVDDKFVFSNYLSVHTDDMDGSMVIGTYFFPMKKENAE